MKLHEIVIGAAIAAAIAIPATASRGSEVRYVPATDVAAAFAKGMPLIESDGYKIHASRREGPGQAEVHVVDTDVIYVVEGTATFLTGGTVEKGATVAPGEIRGASIAGGTSRALGKGDVVVVPNGVPHQFVTASNPFLYYVVKVASTGAAK